MEKHCFLRKIAFFFTEEIQSTDKKVSSDINSTVSTEITLNLVCTYTKSSVLGEYKKEYLKAYTYKFRKLTINIQPREPCFLAT